LRWHRQLIARKYDGSPGESRTSNYWAGDC
jgi:hypothetical protein